MQIKSKSKKQKLKRKNTWVDINDSKICQKILQKHYGSLFPTGGFSDFVKLYQIIKKGFNRNDKPSKVPKAVDSFVESRKKGNHSENEVATPTKFIEGTHLKQSTPKKHLEGSQTKNNVEENNLQKNKTVGKLPNKADSNECNKVQVKIKEGSSDFHLLLLELMKDTMNFDKRKAVIKFKTKEAAINFIKNEKVKAIFENKQLVEILPCEESASNTDGYSCNAVEFDIKQSGLVGDMQSSFKELAYQYLCVLMFIDEELEVDKTTAIITFNTEADAINFMNEKKWEDHIESRRLVKTVPCQNTSSISSQSSSSSSVAENRSKTQDECNKVDVDIVGQAGNYQLLLSKLMCNKIHNVYKGKAVITFNSHEDAVKFIRKQPWKKVVENPRLVRTEPCGNSETQQKNSKGVSKRRKRKYPEIADQMAEAAIQKYHKRMKQFD